MEKRNYNAIITYLLTKNLFIMEKNFRVHQVKNTPFCIAENGEKHCVVMGQYKVSEDFTTKEEAENYIKKKPWELITIVMGIISEKVLNEINNSLKTK